METPTSDCWKIPKKWPKRIFWSLLVFTIIYIFTAPITDEITDRSRAAELILSTGDARQQVEKMLLEKSSRKIILNATALIPETIGAKSKDGEKIEIAYRDISESGEIKVYTPQLGVLLVFTPKLSDGKVTWSCWGRPLKMVPSSCRENS